MSRWLVGSSRINTLAPDATRIASATRRRSPPESPSIGFSASSPQNRNRPSSGARLVGREAGGALCRLEDGARGPELLGVLGEVPELHVVAGAQPPAIELAAAGQRLDQRRLAGAVRPDERHVFAPLQPQLAVLEQRPAGHLEPPALHVEHHPPRSLRAAELEAERAVVAWDRARPLHLVELLHPRLGLARLGRLVAEALDEALHPGDLRLLLLDLLAELDLARGRLAAPRVPRAREEARAPGLELQHRGADRLEEPAVVRHEDHRGVELGEVLLEPLERDDVEVIGGLVEQQQVGVARQRAGERGARELAAGEARELAVELLVGEAEPVQRAERAGAPVPAARVLET